MHITTRDSNVLENYASLHEGFKSARNYAYMSESKVRVIYDYYNEGF